MVEDWLICNKMPKKGKKGKGKGKKGYVNNIFSPEWYVLVNMLERIVDYNNPDLHYFFLVKLKDV